MRLQLQKKLLEKLQRKVSDLLDDEVQSAGITQDHPCFGNDLARVLS